MFEFEIEGLEELKRNLNELGNEVENLPKKLKLKDLFTTDFITKNTKFASLDDMFNSSGFVIESQEDFDKIPYDEWNNFIKNHTNFSSWEEILQTAYKE